MQLGQPTSLSTAIGKPSPFRTVGRALAMGSEVVGSTGPVHTLAVLLLAQVLCTTDMCWKMQAEADIHACLALDLERERHLDIS